MSRTFRMAISRENVIQRVVNQLPRMGIATEVEGEKSHTVRLVEAIVTEVINELLRNGEVVVVEANSIGQSAAGPVNTTLIQPGRGIIR